MSGFVAWAQTVDWQAWAMFAQAAAIGGAAIVAKVTFDDWRRQLVFKRQFELAEQALIAFDEAAGALKDARNPISVPEELDRAEHELDHDNPDQRLRTAQVIVGRLTDRQVYWDRISALRSPLRIHFGKEISDAFVVPLRAAYEVRSAAKFYARGGGTDEFQNRMEAKIWADSEIVDNTIRDTMGEKVEAARAELEQTLITLFRDH